jgi:hypothetical protein
MSEYTKLEELKRKWDIRRHGVCRDIDDINFFPSSREKFRSDLEWEKARYDEFIEDLESLEPKRHTKRILKKQLAAKTKKAEAWKVAAEAAESSWMLAQNNENSELSKETDRIAHSSMKAARDLEMTYE